MAGRCCRVYCQTWVLWSSNVSGLQACITHDSYSFSIPRMEAVACGCYPLCPNRLVYPELYPSMPHACSTYLSLVYATIAVGECLYNTDQQLFKSLSRYCERPWLLRPMQIKVCDSCSIDMNKLMLVSVLQCACMFLCISQVDFSKFTWTKLKRDYHELLNSSW